MATNKSQLIFDGNDANGDDGIDYANSSAPTAAGILIVSTIDRSCRLLRIYPPCCL